jgi:hypothetical protein
MEAHNNECLHPEGGSDQCAASRCEFAARGVSLQPEGVSLQPYVRIHPYLPRPQQQAGVPAQVSTLYVCLL